MDKIEKLKELSELLKSNAITQDEYDVMKAELISSDNSSTSASATNQKRRTGIGWQEVLAVMTGIFGGIVYAIFAKQGAKKKLSVFSLSFLWLIILSVLSANDKESMQNTKNPDANVNLPQVTSSSSSQDNNSNDSGETAEQPPESPLPIQQSSENQATSDVLTEFQTISIKCGSPQDFLGLSVSVDCPLDEDKDGRRDSPTSKMTFSNPLEQTIYLNIPNFGNVEKPVLTIAIPPKSSWVGTFDNSQFNSQTNEFNGIELGLGKFELSASNENTFSKTLSCGKSVEGIKQTTFGVKYQLKCTPEISLFLDKQADGLRAVRLSYTNEQGGKSTLNFPDLKGYGGSSFPLPPSANYELEILIPDSPVNIPEVKN